MNIKELFKENKVFVFKVLVIFVCALVLVNTFDHEGKGYKGDSANLSTITVTGKAEVNAVPDIATINFSITKDGKTVKEAQVQVAEVEAKVLANLKENKIEEKDIKTINSSFYPKYEYQTTSSKYAPEIDIYPPVNTKSVIIGYTATLSIEVKVRDTDNAGKVITDLGTLGITDLSGPNFKIDDEDNLKAQARKEAIEDARAKAKVLAKDLGVHLGRIASFSETPSYGTPIYYAKASLESADAGASLQLPKGENTITSEVSITYKIK